MTAVDVADLLLDLFGRVPPLAREATEGLDAERLVAQPGPNANTIGWLVWHLARVQDAQIAELVDEPQVWEQGDWAARFGLGSPSGAEIPGESSGHLPRSDASGEIVGEQWYSGSTLQFAIGQASLMVTPLQVVRMVAAVANDGYLVTPRFVQDEPTAPVSLESSSIELVSFSSTPSRPGVQKISGLSPGTLASVREGMRMVVEHHQGTGKRLKMDDVAMAGKTGTAEVGGGKQDHAWFVGYAPADDPKVAFAVVIEHGGHGGTTAAPVARRVLEVYFADRLPPPEPPQLQVASGRGTGRGTLAPASLAR